MSWTQLDSFSSNTGRFILRPLIITGGRYAIELVNEPIGVYRTWVVIVISEAQAASFGGSRVSFSEVRATTPIHQFLVTTPRPGWTRRFAYFFPQRDRLGPRTVRLWREDGS